MFQFVKRSSGKGPALFICAMHKNKLDDILNHAYIDIVRCIINAGGYLAWHIAMRHGLCDTAVRRTTQRLIESFYHGKETVRQETGCQRQGPQTRKPRRTIGYENHPARQHRDGISPPQHGRSTDNGDFNDPEETAIRPHDPGRRRFR